MTESETQNIPEQQDFIHVKIGAASKPVDTLATDEDEEIIFIGTSAMYENPTGDKTPRSVSSQILEDTHPEPATAPSPLAEAADKTIDEAPDKITDETADKESPEEPLGPMSTTQRIVIVISVIGVVVAATYFIHYYFFA
jgi:hypothetical protein